MKSNIISSAMWFALILLSSALLLGGFIIKNELLLFAPLCVFLITFGFLYYVTNSYIVYRKLIFLEMSTRKNWLLIIFPFLTPILKKELNVKNFVYNGFLKFLTIIIPLMISFVISGLINTLVIIYSIEKIGETNLSSSRFYVSLAFSIVLGWGMIILGFIFVLSTLVKLRSTGFYKEKQNIFKKIWRTIFLHFYFPKFYFEQLEIKKSSKPYVPISKFFRDPMDNFFLVSK